jgi:dienelactone hydrolase
MATHGLYGMTSSRKAPVRRHPPRLREATGAILAGLCLLWGASCAPALHASAVEPMGVRVGRSSFQSNGHRIRVDVYQPRAGGRRPAVIVIHGSSGVSKVVPDTATSYARALAEQGLIAFVVHYFDVTGTIMADLAAESRHYEVWAQVLRDAVTWVARYPGVDPGEVGILGHSLGAFLAVGVAASDTRVSRVVLFGGGLEPFLPTRILRMPPTLMFHGDQDTDVPLTEARILVDFLKARHCDITLHVLSGERHNFGRPAVDEALTESVRFFTPALRERPSP